MQATEGTEEYGGPAALSESETRILKLVAQTSRPQAYVNLHSGEWAMYLPWDSKPEAAPDVPVRAPLSHIYSISHLPLNHTASTSTAPAVSGLAGSGMDQESTQDPWCKGAERCVCRLTLLTSWRR